MFNLGDVLQTPEQFHLLGVCPSVSIMEECESQYTKGVKGWYFSTFVQKKKKSTLESIACYEKSTLFIFQAKPVIP